VPAHGLRAIGGRPQGVASGPRLLGRAGLGRDSLSFLSWAGEKGSGAGTDFDDYPIPQRNPGSGGRRKPRARHGVTSGVGVPCGVSSGRLDWTATLPSQSVARGIQGVKASNGVRAIRFKSLLKSDLETERQVRGRGWVGTGVNYPVRSGIPSYSSCANSRGDCELGGWWSGKSGNR